TRHIRRSPRLMVWSRQRRARRSAVSRPCAPVPSLGHPPPPLQNGPSRSPRPRVPLWLPPPPSCTACPGRAVRWCGLLQWAAAARWGRVQRDAQAVVTGEHEGRATGGAARKCRLFYLSVAGDLHRGGGLGPTDPREFLALEFGERAERVVLATRHGGLHVTTGHRSYRAMPIMATGKPNDPLVRLLTPEHPRSTCAHAHVRSRMHVEDFSDDLPLPLDFHQRQHVRVTMPRPVVEFQPHRRDRFANVEARDSRFEFRRWSVLIDPIEDLLNRASEQVVTEIAEDRRVRMKGSLHDIAAARPAAIDIDLNRLGDRVSFAFRRSCRCHGFLLALEFSSFHSIP